AVCRVIAEPHGGEHAPSLRSLRVARRPVHGQCVKDETVAGLEAPGQHLVLVELGVEIGLSFPGLVIIGEGVELAPAGKPRPEPAPPAMRRREEAERHRSRYWIDRQPDRAHLPTIDAEI